MVKLSANEFKYVFKARGNLVKDLLILPNNLIISFELPRV
ncbi:hypothetical protein DSBG_2708 [Desulfosporosinus sp. BG]|nr:hypothetical protein DSBG_2708 [Desulfosporosinus sp. BG]